MTCTVSFVSHIMHIISYRLLWVTHDHNNNHTVAYAKLLVVTRLRCLQVMQVATPIHDRIMRAKISHYNGYEVTTEGDAFIVAFHDPADAVSWCM